MSHMSAARPAYWVTYASKGGNWAELWKSDSREAEIRIRDLQLTEFSRSMSLNSIQQCLVLTLSGFS
jgi:hypothetical protein